VEGRFGEGRFVEGRFVEGRFVEGCFVEGRFVEVRFVLTPSKQTFASLEKRQADEFRSTWVLFCSLT
jgi:hypothetical protein